METIKIQYHPTVSNEVITELSDGFSKYANVSFILNELPSPNTENWDNSLTDLALYFQNHDANILDGVIGTIGVELIKAAYRKLTKLIRDRASLNIKLDYSDVKAEFNLEGKLTDQQTDKCFDNFRDVIIKETIFSDYSNPDYQQGAKGRIHREVPLPHQFNAIQYYFDAKSGIFKVHNFAEHHKRLQKKMEDFGH